MAYTDPKLAEKIVAQCMKEYQAGLDFRLQKEKVWADIEDAYYNRTKKNIKGKFNVPVPVVPGFVDTWLSQIKSPIDLTFGQSESADYRASKKIQGFYTEVKDNDDHDWRLLDEDGKKFACLYGKADYEYQATSDPKYQSNLELIDPYDMIDDPMGGSDTEKFRFRMRDNIFKSKESLKEGVDRGTYNARQITLLINGMKDETLVDNDTPYQSKKNRFIGLNADNLTYNYAGQTLYRLVVAGTTYNSQRYYVVFNRETGLWIRCELLKDVFKSNLWPWTGWKPNAEAFVSLPKAPVEDIMPIAEVIRVLVNQEIDNRNKRNYGQRAYDPGMFPNGAELEWRQDGLVAVKAGESRIRPIQSGIYQFETPEMQGTINLVNWMDQFLKEKTGVNSEAQGQSGQDRVGIAFLNVQQSAERMKKANEARQKCWKAIGRRFVWGLKEHMRAPIPVRILGEKGYTWDQLARVEINPDLDIKIATLGDAASDEIKKKSLRETLSTLTPQELMVINPKRSARIKFLAADVDEDTIMEIFDMTDEESKEALSMASQMIQNVLHGKPIKKPYRGATTGFLQKILDFTQDEDLPDDKYAALIQLAEMHKKIVAENMMRKATEQAPPVQEEEGGKPQYNRPANMIPGGGGIAPEAPMAEGTQEQSQSMTAMAPRTNAY